MIFAADEHVGDRSVINFSDKSPTSKKFPGQDLQQQLSKMAPMIMMLTFVLANAKPNIIFFMADDLGWNNVGWHNAGLNAHLTCLSNNW